MKPRELENLGIPRGETMQLAIRAVIAARDAGLDKDSVRAAIRALVERPIDYSSDARFGALASALVDYRESGLRFQERASPARFVQWGSGLDEQALTQMRNACWLPVSVVGALMPDAHQGYGLPIGGVLATKNAVIPYAVGVDIACRMKMTVLDLPVSELDRRQDRLARAIEDETQFGVGAIFKKRRVHAVMDEDWSVTKLTAHLKDKAWSQLGTSGSGNHFVEFGTLALSADDLGLRAGSYVALLSHSGSRGAGSSVAEYYSRAAMAAHPELPRELAYLAWLDLDSETGQEYWVAMELMGRYAAANHQLIHRYVARHLGAAVLLDIENHHNFAWKETHGGQEVIVHRKGATPAGRGVLGIIPGSMATAGYVVRGAGNPDSLDSASHGAGRRMSRTAAREQFTWKDARAILADRGVTVLSAGIDEAPMAYKNIDDVMAAQADLVMAVARFDPRLVKMAPAGEKPAARSSG
ncbi:MAG: RtcB family protein [Acidobacteriota bacterium]